MADIEVKYYFIKWKILAADFILVLMSGMLVGLAILLWVYNGPPAAYLGPLYFLPIILLGFPTAYRHTIHSFNDEPAIILSKEALVDNVNDQIYKWSEIKEISYLNFSSGKGSSKVIAIKPNDPGAFLGKIKDPATKLLVYVSRFISGSYFIISPMAISGKNKAILESLLTFYNEYR